jgi:predicted glutamine amidotransferase
MCVICASPAGVRQPSISEIKRMFFRNPDGAGYMVARNGRVEIHKGFMTLGDFLTAIKSEHFTAEDSVVYHFRISTQAGINPAMTHPFPLSNQPALMKALDVICGCGVAHNGVIRLTSDPNEHEYSDTALFITEYLSDYIREPADLKCKQLLNAIGLLIQSKMALLDGSGYIATIGEFFNDRGLLYSNLNHRY